MLNFYPIFVPHVGDSVCTPLTDLLAGKKKDAALEWKEEHQWTFDTATPLFSSHPVVGAPLAPTVDSSLFVIGGTLE